MRREGAQGWPEGAGGRLVPVLARLTPEEVVELLHAGGRDGVGLHAGERQACPLDDAHEAALGLLHLARGAPEDEHSFGGAVDKLLGPPQHTEHAGVGHHAEGGLVAHVRRVARGGRVVHADRALRPLDFGAQFGAQQVAGAGDNHTLVAPGGQCLRGKESQQYHSHSGLGPGPCTGLQEPGATGPDLSTGKPQRSHSTPSKCLQPAGEQPNAGDSNGQETRLLPSRARWGGRQ